MKSLSGPRIAWLAVLSAVTAASFAAFLPAWPAAVAIAVAALGFGIGIGRG